MSSVFDDNQKVYTCQPQSYNELIDIVKRRIDEEGNECDLNDIDTSRITDMSFLFHLYPEFNGDISDWDVSNVTNMSFMFYGGEFNKNISKWDVHNVIKMTNMFESAKFNQDISMWDINPNCNTSSMFATNKEFRQDLSNWNLKHVFKNTFRYGYPEEYKPKQL